MRFSPTCCRWRSPLVEAQLKNADVPGNTQVIVTGGRLNNSLDSMIGDHTALAIRFVIAEQDPGRRRAVAAADRVMATGQHSSTG